jgi:hypothetical protein
MNLFSSWKSLNVIWGIVEPFVLNLIKKQVPDSITKLYENLAKFTHPAIDSLFKLKNKIKDTPNSLDDYCFNQGVDALDSFAHYLLETIEKLRA